MGDRLMVVLLAIAMINPAAGQPTCLDDWVANQDKCYKCICGHNRGYDDARAYCQSFGGDLASINDQDEQEFLDYDIWYSYSTGLTYGEPAWIGLRRDGNLESVVDTTEDYYWVDGTSVRYDNFFKGYPNSFFGTENCTAAVYGEMNYIYSFYWHNYPCEQYACMICEAPAVEDPTTSVPPTIPPDPACHPDDPDDEWIQMPDDTEFCYWIPSISDPLFLDWLDAYQSCLDKGGLLTSIHSNEENMFLMNKMNLFKPQSFWIGFVRSAIDGDFLWVDNSSVSFTRWAPNEPNDAGDMESCASMSPNDGYWNDQHCNNEVAPFICKKPRDGSWPSPPTIPPPGNGHCPEGMKEFDGHCWSMQGWENSAARRSWKSALEECEGQGLNLASVHSERENAFLITMLDDTPLDSKVEFWLGGNEATWSWAWEDQTSFDYSNWAGGEPNGYYDQGDCIEFYVRNALDNVGKWNDNSCDSLFGYICKTRVLPENPTPDPPKACDLDENHQEFYSYNGECFKWMGEEMTWEEAERSCQNQDAHLVSILNVYEQSYVHTRAEAEKSWTGLSNRLNEDVLIWSDGFRLNYTNFDRESANPGADTCVTINSVTGKWKTESCEQRLPFMCKYSLAPPPTPSPSGFCREGYIDLVPSSEYCYRVEDYTYPWAGAASQCTYLGGQLASVHSDEVNEALHRECFSKRVLGCWLGLQADYAGRWTWIDGSPYDYNHWGEGEPNHEQDDGMMYCAQYYSQDAIALWDDYYCYSYLYYICQAQKVQVEDPTGPSDSDEGLSGGAVAGIVIFVLALVTGAAVFFVVLHKKDYKIRNMFSYRRTT